MELERFPHLPEASEQETAQNSRLHPSSILADFPAELVHLIFHYAAASSTGFCLSLCLVSSWARHLALPHLFSTVVVKGHGTNQKFCQSLRTRTLHNPPTPKFHHASYVRNIWIEAVSNRILEIFESCDNIVNIALNQDGFLWHVYAASNGTLSAATINRKQDLQLVLLNAGKRWTQDRYLHEVPCLSPPFFNKITRMRLAQISKYEGHLNIAHFTRLTHFALPFYSSKDHRLSELDHLLEIPSMEMLVVVVLTDLVSPNDRMEAVSWVQRKRRTTSGIYLVESVSDGIQQEWEGEVRGGKSLWDRAVMFTANLG